jgi:hypothetical protein
VLLVALVAACGIGTDSELQTINQDDLLGLDETTTSTSTTTTVPDSVPAVVESTVAATSTTIATESVQLYFVDGTRLQPVTIDLAGTATPDRVVQALLAGRPLGEIGIGLRTLLPPGLVNSPVVDSGAGFVIVDLATEPFNRIDPSDQRTAIAQIVMTLVSRPGIGQVQFTLDGVPLRVPRRDGLQSEPGEGVFRNDYESLLDAVDQPTTTVAPVTTTVPVEAPPPPTASPGP